MFQAMWTIIATAFCCFFISSVALSKEEVKPWLRVGSTLNYIKADPKKNRYLAYTDRKDGGLYVLDMKTKKNHIVSRKNVNGSFVWSPDGIRIVFRPQVKVKGHVKASLSVYDLFLGKMVKLDELAHQSGFLTFDPRDNKIMLMHEKGVIQKTLKFPDSRLAKWQMKLGQQRGRWLVGEGGVVFLNYNGRLTKRLEDDNSGVESFDISPNGQKIVWATKNASIFYAIDGKESKFLDYGRDPKWDKSSEQIIYAGAHLVGKRVSGFDLKMTDLNNNKKWLTKTPMSNERWPELLKNGTLLYTKSSSTDIYALNLLKML